jgi:arginyl-tRNA synthetase
VNLYRALLADVLERVAALADRGALPAGLPTDRIVVEPSRDPAHGDIATNAAMALAGPAKLRPRDLAAALVPELAGLPGVVKAEVAGPGFINLTLAPAFWHRHLGAILVAGEAYGDAAIGGGVAINVEYVSANPTGPLHVGHGRGAVVGDALASLLAKAGFRPTREYYINDAGGQVDALARSLHARYRLACGALSAEAFEEMRAAGAISYGGAYLAPVAEALVKRDGRRWLEVPESAWLEPLRAFACTQMLALIEDDLRALGITFDVKTSERAIVESGGITAAIERLSAQGLIYEGELAPPKGKVVDDWEPRPQTLFRATAFGDEVDRPLRKSDGAWTYFAADIAYHFDKFRRGFATMIDVWGADHGGYVKRMQAAVRAITDAQATLDVKLCQLVNLLDHGAPVKMSKRAGTFITLREVLDRVGRDVFRFIMLTRRNDAALDFDFQKVTEQTRDNPVFYVQYAHARTCSVLRLAASDLGEAAVADSALAAAPFARLADGAEIDLIKALAGWPRLVEAAAEAHEPHRIAFFLQDVAALFHNLWTKGKDDARLRFIHPEDASLTLARLALVRATQIVIASALKVIGVEPVRELR